MYKCLYILLIFFLISFKSISQDSKIDSLIIGSWYNCEINQEYNEFYIDDSIIYIYNLNYFNYFIKDSFLYRFFDQSIDQDTFPYKVVFPTNNHFFLTYQKDTNHFYRITEPVKYEWDYSCDFKMNIKDYIDLIDIEFYERADKIKCPKKESEREYHEFNIEVSDTGDIIPIPTKGPILLDFEYSTSKDSIVNTKTNKYNLISFIEKENGILEIEIGTIDKCYSVYKGLINLYSDSELNLIFKEDIGKCDEVCNLKLKFIIDPNGIKIRSIKINDYKIKN